MNEKESYKPTLRFRWKRSISCYDTLAFRSRSDHMTLGSDYLLQQWWWREEVGLGEWRDVPEAGYDDNNPPEGWKEEDEQD